MTDDAASSGERARADAPSSPSGTVTREIPITNKRGLHARASAKFVKMVEQFDAEVLVTRAGGEETVNGASIMGLLMLSAAPGTTIIVSATGPQAEAAVAALAELVGSKFNEEE
jgi:phosphocarrier protein